MAVSDANCCMIMLKQKKKKNRHNGYFLSIFGHLSHTRKISGLRNKTLYALYNKSDFLMTSAMWFCKMWFCKTRKLPGYCHYNSLSSSHFPPNPKQPAHKREIATFTALCSFSKFFNIFGAKFQVIYSPCPCVIATAAAW